MSDDVVIRVDHLSKRYVLNHQRSGDGLRHVMQDRLAAPWRAMRARLSGKSKVEGSIGNQDLNLNSSPSTRAEGAQEEFWALKDVSFEVKSGEVVGIIGRNGAGKSTLLKILSRITEPTSGQIEIDGRVASLLEVGTGFHPELTGRENIFLNGAILGMSRTEIRTKFDAIVAFAEVERFLDTPVKRYSSGMYVRLAFAVAAHLDPEILIVDEVLAVGDAAFQKKCLGKIGEVSAREGRTVLFVSHNMAAVEQLCRHCILLSQGSVAARGPAAEIARLYADQGNRPGQVVQGKDGLSMTVELKTAEGGPLRAWRYGERLRIEIGVECRAALVRPAVDLALYGGEGQRLISIRSDRVASSPARCQGGVRFICEIDNPGFTVGEMTLDVGLREGAASNYLLLQTEAARLGTDYISLPEGAGTEGLVYPLVSQHWEISS